MLFLALFCMFKSIEPLSFDNHEKTDIVIRFPMSAKVYVSTKAGSLTRDLPHGNPMVEPLGHQDYIYI